MKTIIIRRCPQNKEIFLKMPRGFAKNTLTTWHSIFNEFPPPDYNVKTADTGGTFNIVIGGAGSGKV